MALLQPNTARNRMLFLGAGLTTASVTISKDGGAFGAPAGSLAAVGTDGWYNLALTAGDTDTPGDLAYFAAAVAGTPNQIAEPDEVSAPVLLGDKMAHGGTPFGSTATLSLASAALFSLDGQALTIGTTASSNSAVSIFAPADSDGMDISGGSGIVLSCQGGGAGLRIAGADSSTDLGIVLESVLTGVSVTARDQALLLASTLSGAMVVFADGTTGAGALLIGASGGPAMQLGDGVNGGIGLLVKGNGAAKPAARFQADSGSNANAIEGVGDGTGAAVQLGDGSAGAEGLKILAGTGNTNAAGILALGAGTKAAMQLGNGTDGGSGLAVNGNSGFDAAVFSSADSNAINLQASGAAALFAQAAVGIQISVTAGPAIDLTNLGGGSTYAINVSDSGLGAVNLTSVLGSNMILADGLGGIGLSLTGAGTGDGLAATGAGTGAAVRLGDGSVGAVGLMALGGLGGTGNNSGMMVTGAGSNAAVQMGDGVAGGEGLSVKGGSSFTAFHVIGGFGTTAVQFEGGGGSGSSANGLAISGGADDSPAVVLSGAGAGSGLDIFGGGTGARIVAGSGNENGLLVLGAGTGAAVQLGDGATGGDGLLVSGNTSISGRGAVFSGGGIGGGSAVAIQSNGIGVGLFVSTQNADAVQLQPVDGHGLTIHTTLSSNPGADGLHIHGSGTGAAVRLGTGTDGQEALLALAGTEGAANAIAIRGVGAGTGAGFSSVDDAVGFGGGSGTVDANIVSVNGTTFVGANVPCILADSVTHGGTSAILSLKQISVLNTTGVAMLVQSTNAASPALQLNATGVGGFGALVSGAIGISVQGTSTIGFKVQGAGANPAMQLGVSGSTASTGLSILGGSANADAVEITGRGLGAGIAVAGGSSGVALELDGGTIGLRITGDGVINPDVVLAGTGLLQGDLGGRILGNTLTTFIGEGVRAETFTLKNTAVPDFPFLMKDATTHAPLPGLTVTAERSIDGGSFAACANAVAAIGSGWYKIDLAASDTNGDKIALRFTAALADDTNLLLITTP